MTQKAAVRNLATLDAVVEPLLRGGRVPGAAVAVVADREIVFAQGYGSRDLVTQQPVTADTVYPIASTTKAINATLLGTLVDEGRLAWDAPVQRYLPQFRLMDPVASSHVTIRDLVIMRTGLPRHDWLWTEHLIGRGDLVGRLQHLQPAAGFRERFQYNNLTVTAAGHVAEVVAGEPWEDLARRRLFEPLGMRHTGFNAPSAGNVTLSYHENNHRELVPTPRLATEVTAPSGGAVHSTVRDVARWILLNLASGEAEGKRLIGAKTLAEIHTPQVLVGTDTSGPTLGASYAMGWFVDRYHGHKRLSHAGYLHDVNSEVMLLPEKGIGIVTFTNFGAPALARYLAERALDVLFDRDPGQTLEEKLTEYERKIAATRQRKTLLPRRKNTSPSHPLDEYRGTYVNPGYGPMEIAGNGEDLVLKRNRLAVVLRHWHYDTWVAKEPDLFGIHMPHAFDGSGCLMFETNADGNIAALSIPLEPTVAPIHFHKQQAGAQ